MELLPLILISPLLIYMGYSDLRYMRIPNRLVLAMLAAFAIMAPFLPRDALLDRLLVATCVFGVGFVAFAFRLFGGGDVKALAALTLFVPPPALTLFGLVFSLSMAFGILAIVTVRRVPGVSRSGWVSLRANGHFPMGISIAAAGLLLPAAVLFATGSRLFGL